tara:strand:+ start:85 stop:288 length:204 start_codon:yes stop_codon:yes gene_type:complete
LSYENTLINIKLSQKNIDTMKILLLIKVYLCSLIKIQNKPNITPKVIVKSGAAGPVIRNNGISRKRK